MHVYQRPCFPFLKKDLQEDYFLELLLLQLMENTVVTTCVYQNAINMSITHINIGQVEVILAPSKFSRVDFFFCCVKAGALTSIIIIWSQQKRIHMNQKIKHQQGTMIQCGSTNSMPMSMGNANKIIQYQQLIWIITTLIKPHDTHNSYKQHPQIKSHQHTNKTSHKHNLTIPKP